MDPLQRRRMKRLILCLSSDDESVDSEPDSPISIDLESVHSQISITSFLKDREENLQIGGAVTTRSKKNLEPPLSPKVPQLKEKKATRKRKLSSTTPIEPKERSPSPSTSKQARTSPSSTPPGSIAEDQVQPSSSQGLSQDGFFDTETKVFENESFSLYIQKQDHIKQKVSIKNYLIDCI